MEKNYIAALLDEEGNEWWYEQTINGQDNFTKKESGFCRPKMLPEAEAIQIARRNADEDSEAAIVLFEGI